MTTLNMLRCAPRALKKQPIWVAPSRNIALTSVNRDAPATTGSKAVLPGHEYYPGKEEYSPVIGHREIVGHGEIPYYTDSFTVPCPAIRFREVDEALGKLREKEKGDWKLLSLEDKKTLYRASFNSTLEEVRAPSGDWKRCIGDNAILMALMFLGVSVIGFADPQYEPKTVTNEWVDAQTEYLIKRRVQPVDGIASWYDYENNKFKPTWSIFTTKETSKSVKTLSEKE
ncbi:cytochrome c oxidase subunit 4 isoform 1, mitochondrial [Magallana gigas]|uniref:Cytochrome c oxidase subunit 4 n=7 Tax=Magallana gigas TaxID=29159 RepID=A0A8W8JWL7_MAGGI|nr:cytochrome c oxidase subunit 4 isoform 1, mitochondrial [Crassostrea gigas]